MKCPNCGEEVKLKRRKGVAAARAELEALRLLAGRIWLEEERRAKNLPGGRAEGAK